MRKVDLHQKNTSRSTLDIQKKTPYVDIPVQPGYTTKPSQQQAIQRVVKTKKLSNNTTSQSMVCLIVKSIQNIQTDTRQFAVKNSLKVNQQEERNNCSGSEDDDQINERDKSVLSTPSSKQLKRSKPAFSSFTPRSRTRVASACKLFRIKFATTKPFPTSTDSHDLAWKSYAETCLPLDEEDMTEVDHLLQKMKKDPTFAKDNLKVVCVVYL
jgi:hypothetical protein